MHVVRVDNLKPGDVLGRTLYNDRRDLVLAAGYRFDRTLIRMLRDRKYTYVYVWDGVADDLSSHDVISEALTIAAKKSVGDALGRSAPTTR